MNERCHRCGTAVSPESSFCAECLLQLVPGEPPGAAQAGLLRKAWEREHPGYTAAYEAWAAKPEGPPPGVTMPYAPPQPPERALGEWKPLDDRLKRLRFVFSALIVLVVAHAISLAMENNLLENLRSGEQVTDPEIANNDLRVILIGSLTLAGYVAAAVVFIQWFHRAYENVDALRTGVRRHGTGWAIGGWFVPILWWWRPKQIANDLWASGAAEGEDASPPPLLLAWWTLWLISLYLSRLSFRNAFGDDADSLIKSNNYDIAASLIDVVGCLLAMSVAVRITQRMQARHDEQQPQQAAPMRFGPTAPEVGPVPFGPPGR